MPNGRCRLHGGATPSGRAHGAFRIGKWTKPAIEERRQAKLLRLQADNAVWVGDRWLAEELHRKADALELAWMDRHHARDARGNFLWVPPKNWGRPRKPRRESPEGSNCANLLNRGRFTKRAKLQRLLEREAFAAAVFERRVAAAPRKRKPIDPEVARWRGRKAAATRARKRLIAIDEAAERERERAEKVAEWRKIGKEPVK